VQGALGRAGAITAARVGEMPSPYIPLARNQDLSTHGATAVTSLAAVHLFDRDYPTINSDTKRLKQIHGFHRRPPNHG
jgi:hypothetical protein